MHPQVDVNGVMVDVEVERLVRAAWRLGWATASSCQGHEGEPGEMPSLGFVHVDDAIEALGILRPIVKVTGHDDREATLMVGGPCTEDGCTCQMTGEENVLLCWWPREVTPRFTEVLESRAQDMETDA